MNNMSVNLYEQKIVKETSDNNQEDKIKDLYFLEPYYWTKGIVSVIGLQDNTNIKLKVLYDNKIVFKQDIILEKDEVKSFEMTAGGYFAIYISAKLEDSESMGVKITAEFSYAPNLALKTITSTWQSSLSPISSIENLYLLDSHKWIKCSVIITGYKDKTIDYSMTLITDGFLQKPLIPRGHIEYGCSNIFSYYINKKVLLLVTGYITNKSLIGSCAEITLIGYYQD